MTGFGRAGTGRRRSARRWRVLAAAAIIAGAWLAVLSWDTQAAAPGDKIFTVANYPVEARARDAVAAKEKAIAEGQRAALRSLMKRLVPVTAYGRLARLRSIDAGRLLESVRVRSERNSTTEYIASLDFIFNADAVRALLEREGLAIADRQAPRVTLVPVWRAPDPAGAAPLPPALAAAQGAKAWSDAWKALDLEHGLSPARLEPQKPQVHADTIKALAAGDAAMLRTFANEYGSETALVVAIAEPDAAARRLHVTLIGQDGVGALNWRRSYRLDMSEPGYTLELAAVVSLGVMEGRWKAATVRGGHAQGAAQVSGFSAGSASQGASGSGGSQAASGSGIRGGDIGSPGGPMQFAVEFRGMTEWADMSRRLAAMPGVEDLDVAGLSGRGARITLRYPGGFERLAEAVARHGMTLRQGAGGWVLSAQP
jgi:hypothetical protein